MIKILVNYHQLHLVYFPAALYLPGLFILFGVFFVDAYSAVLPSDIESRFNSRMETAIIVSNFNLR
jgi:hypothetical protein